MSLLVLVPGCAAAAQQRRAPLPPTRELDRFPDLMYCDELPWECDRRVEARQLRVSEWGPVRDGPVLRLRLRSGRQIEVRDTIGPDSVIFSYERHLRAVPYYRLHVQWYHGEQAGKRRYALLNDSTGAMSLTRSDHRFSPDFGFVLARDAHRVELWRLGHDSAVLEWSREGRPWAMTLLDWLDDRSLRVTPPKPDPRRPELSATGPDGPAAGVLRRSASGWRLRRE